MLLAGPIDDLLADHIGAEAGLLESAGAARPIVAVGVCIVVTKRFDEAGARVVAEEHGLVSVGAGGILRLGGGVADDGDGLGASFLGLGRSSEVGSPTIDS